MLEQEHRSQQQIRREAAERFAIMVAIAARKAEAKRGRPTRREIRRARSSAAEPA